MRFLRREYRHDVHVHGDPGVEARLRAIECKLDLILAKQEKIMEELDRLLVKVTNNGDRLDSINTLIDGLRKQVEDALSGATLPPAVQAKIAAVFTQAEANAGKIDKALNANVPSPHVPGQPPA